MDHTDAFLKPSEYFHHPADVLRSVDFTKEEKIKILKNWKQSCEHMEESVEEGMEESTEEAMDRDENTQLQEVSDALMSLSA